MKGVFVLAVLVVCQFALAATTPTACKWEKFDFSSLMGKGSGSDGYFAAKEDTETEQHTFWFNICNGAKVGLCDDQAAVCEQYYNHGQCYESKGSLGAFSWKAHPLGLARGAVVTFTGGVDQASAEVTYECDSAAVPIISAAKTSIVDKTGRTRVHFTIKTEKACQYSWPDADDDCKFVTEDKKYKYDVSALANKGPSKNGWYTAVQNTTSLVYNVCKGTLIDYSSCDKTTAGCLMVNGKYIKVGDVLFSESSPLEESLGGEGLGFRKTYFTPGVSMSCVHSNSSYLNDVLGVIFKCDESATEPSLSEMTVMDPCVREFTFTSKHACPIKGKKNNKWVLPTVLIVSVLGLAAVAVGVVASKKKKPARGDGDFVRLDDPEGGAATASKPVETVPQAEPESKPEQ